MLTERLEVRLPREGDRGRFVELFGDEDFMVFAGVLEAGAANERFDRMLVNGGEIPFAKQPVVERVSGVIVGYVGVDWIDVEGRRWLEFGYRLIPAARGRGYATEAGWALLVEGTGTFRGEILAIIDPANHPSQNVAGKLGFAYWKRGVVEGDPVNLYRRLIGTRG